MDTFYTAYTKLVNGKTFYFIKKFFSFPELNDVPPILESYGMHSNFYRACGIAGIKDESVIKKLQGDIEGAESNRAKVIHMNTKKSITAAQ